MSQDDFYQDLEKFKGNMAERRFGLLDRQPRTLAEAGAEFDPTPERVRMLEGKMRDFRRRGD